MRANAFLFCFAAILCACNSPAVQSRPTVHSRRPVNCEEMEAEYRIMNFLCNDDNVDPSRREEICRAAIDMDNRCEYDAS
jgi:hypothetical protein